MRSTLSSKARAPESMPRGQPAGLTVERVILKAHRVEVLQALAKAPEGLPHRSIQYEVVRSSAASQILNEFVELRLVEWRDNLYFITPTGKDTLAAVERLRAVHPPVGNGGAGGR